MKKQLMIALSCLPFFCSILMAPLSAAAPAQETINSEFEQIIAEKLAREEADREEFENSGEELEELSEDDEDALANEGLFGFFEKPSYITTHTGAWHFATGVSGTGNHVFLEDGSGWKIARTSANKTLDWMGDDVILVIPAPWYSFYNYMLVNYTRDVKVYANLKERPKDYNVYTLFITEINYGDKTLTLNDRTVWSYGGLFDPAVVNTWYAGQKVLIGINTSWWTMKNKPNLLISVEPGVDGMIRARCLY